jgi:CrcB protein
MWTSRPPGGKEPLFQGLFARPGRNAAVSGGRGGRAADSGTMPTALLVALGGAAGALARYGIALRVGTRAFPWATLAVNLSGCFLLGLVLGGLGPSRWSASTTTAVAVGVLGAYTTFSTFGYETFTLLRTDRFGAAAAYVALSVAGGLAATAGGYAAGRVLT